MRTPYLQLGGEDQYDMVEDEGFLYDSSMYGGSLEEDFSPLVWPFTLDYPPSPDVCDTIRCPAVSHPGVWEIPLRRQYTVDGATSCAMSDGCITSASATVEEVEDFLLHNFLRHYNSNRAPFMISMHATWFSTVPNSFQALRNFLRDLTLLEDVYQVSLSQTVAWIQNPTDLASINVSVKCFS